MDLNYRTYHLVYSIKTLQDYDNERNVTIPTYYT